MNDQPLILLGNGGHAKVLTECLMMQGLNILGFVDKVESSSPFGLPYLGDDSYIETLSPHSVMLVNGIGSASSLKLRKSIFSHFKNQGYQFASIIHPSAIISSHSMLAEGVQIMAGAVIQPFARIGENSIINTRASIDHDCVIRGNCHIAPGSTVCGGVIVHAGAYIGAGYTLIQNISIGEEAIIGAGSLVLHDISPRKKAYGVPCKEVG